MITYSHRLCKLKNRSVGRSSCFGFFLFLLVRFSVLWLRFFFVRKYNNFLVQNMNFKHCYLRLMDRMLQFLIAIALLRHFSLSLVRFPSTFEFDSRLHFDYLPFCTLTMCFGAIPISGKLSINSRMARSIIWSILDSLQLLLLVLAVLLLPQLIAASTLILICVFSFVSLVSDKARIYSLYFL